jgi:hypothetical protein
MQTKSRLGDHFGFGILFERIFQGAHIMTVRPLSSTTGSKCQSKQVFITFSVPDWALEYLGCD